jgi:hypothetical protein
MVAHIRIPSAVATESARAIDRASSTASAEVEASVPTQTIRVTPASEARAMAPASREA